MFATAAFVLCAALCVNPAGAAAQSIVGKTVDATSGAPIVTAAVELLDGVSAVRARVLTDSTGAFRVMAPLPGRYRLRITMIGYATIESGELAADQGTQLEVDVRMDPEAVGLEPIRVVARREFPVGRLAEYYERAEWTKRTGNGRVFMRDEIERLRPIRITHLLQMVPRRRDCPMSYFLDGIPIELSDLDLMISPEEVEGVEVYRSALQLPPEYAGLAACGATLVWLRRDLPGRPLTWKRLAAAVGVVAIIWLLLGR